MEEEFLEYFKNYSDYQQKYILNYINTNYTANKEIKEAIQDLQEIMRIGKEENSLSKEDIERIQIEIKDFGKLLGD